jgi:hypothetical protein
VAADVEQKAFVIHRAADAADVSRVFLDNGYSAAGFGKRVGRGQTGGTRPDDENVGTLQLTRSAGKLRRNSSLKG